MRSLLPPALAVALAAVLLGACGGSAAVACSPVTREALDPSSGLHVLPGEEVPPFATDPPTSGAHYSLPPPTGVVDEPLERPMQVTLLESGAVLLQHRDLPPDEAADLQARAGADVVVAPAPDLPEPLVMTAWLTTRSCSGLAPAEVDAFIEDHRGGGPGTDF